jgi:hypothetical protein
MQISSRWNLLKGQFSLSVEKGERVSASRTGKRERGIWQRRFWAHLTPIKEISTGMSNIDWNPVKHGKAGSGLALFQFSSLCKTRRLPLDMGLCRRV